MTETDEAIDKARHAIDRVKARGSAPLHAARHRRPGGLKTKLALIAAVNALLLIAAGVVGYIIPIGIFGALLVMLLMLAATLAIAFAPTARPVAYETLQRTDLARLPAQTERWLDAQRPSLPAPARTIADQIGVRLDTLGRQLEALDEAEPAAAEVRKLVGERLPEFVRGYQQVPEQLRTTPRNGKTPDAQLVDGLTLIERELARASETLAQGDLDALATRGRFLEIKYQGE